jgi:serine/threonine-protein kinase
VDSEDENINLDFLKYARRSITVHTSSFDSVTNKDISDITDFSFLNNNGKWVSAYELTPNEFTNGRVWSVKAKAKGYKTEEFELRIEWYQDELFITATLEPK